MTIVKTTTASGAAPIVPTTGPAPMVSVPSGQPMNPYRNPVQGSGGTLPIKGGVS